VIRTYGRGRGVEVVTTADVGATVGAGDACAVVALPGFLGTVAEIAPVAQAARAVGAISICCADPIACALLTPPGDLGFDITVGDGQPLGIPPSFGGPHLGFMAVRQELMRRMPGRLVGLTHDHDGRRAYALTLQAREQHIRREKATSNICTNHALTALAATVYMARMGGAGMRRVAEISVQRAHALAARLTVLDGFELAEPAHPYLWEFALRVPGDAEDFARAMRHQGIVAGLPLGRFDPDRREQLLVCCTETSPPTSLDRYVEAASRFAGPVTVSP
jgi:glycine dehydrogenase subunit 1